MKNKKTWVLFVFSLIVLMGDGFFAGWVLANPDPSSSGYSEGGPHPGAPSYTVWVEGSTYYAKDAYGAIPFESSNASYVINLGFASADKTVLLEIGTYTLTAPILMRYSNLWLIGEDREATILSTSSNIDIIKVYPNSGYIENVKIANLWLKGMGVGSTSMGLNVTGKVYYSTFEQITATANYNGLHFQATWTTRGARSRLSSIHAKNNLACGLFFSEQDGFNLYKIDSHENPFNLWLEEKCQGFVIDSYRGDSATTGDMRIKDAQGLRMINSWISASTLYGVVIDGGSTDISIQSSYIEASGDVQIYIYNEYAYSSYDIRILNNRIVRGEKQGISIGGANNKNNTNIRIEQNTIINNGQAANNTYWGIEAYGTGASATSFVYIINNYIGNDPEESGLDYQRGITSTQSSNYFMVIGNDVSTSLWTAAITEQITLVGANNIIEHNFGDA